MKKILRFRIKKNTAIPDYHMAVEEAAMKVKQNYIKMEMMLLCDISFSNLK